MAKLLSRFIALTLIPCFLADPATATVLFPARQIRNSAVDIPVSDPFSARLEQEALAAKWISTHRDIGNFLAPRKWAVGIALGLLAEGAVLRGSPKWAGWATSLLALFFANVYAGYPELHDKPKLRQIVKELKETEEFHDKTHKAIAVFSSARFPPNDPLYKLGEELGRELFLAGMTHSNTFPPRTGAGPSGMESVLKGYIEARQAAGIPKNDDNVTQGVRIQLYFEQGINPFVEKCIESFHFITRKLGLHRNTYGAIALPGGYGTLDESFEVRQRRRPLVLLEPTKGPYAYFWTNMTSKFDEAWKITDLKSQFPPRPFITSSPKEAVAYIANSSPHRWNGKIVLNRSIKEVIEGLRLMDKWENAITFVGRPAKGSLTWKTAGLLINQLLSEGKTVRVATRGPLIEAVANYVHAPEKRKHLQATLFIPPGEKLRPVEKKLFANIAITHDPSIHQVFVAKKTEAFVFSPGGVGTMNRLFDIVQLIQTEMIPRVPILLNGLTFWPLFMNHIFQIMLKLVPIIDEETGLQKVNLKTRQLEFYSLISSGDETFFHFIDTPDEGKKILIPALTPRSAVLSQPAVHIPSFTFLRPFKKRIKLVIWDFNGTICKIPLARILVRIKTEKAPTPLELTGMRIWLRSQKGKPALFELQNELGLDDHTLRERYFRATEAEVRMAGQSPSKFLIEGVRSRMEEIDKAGIKQIVVTSGLADPAEQYLKNVGLWKHLSGIFGEAVKSEKIPSVLSMYRFLPEEAVIIGNSRDDEMTAKEIGINAILLAYSSKSRDFLIKNGIVNAIVFQNFKDSRDAIRRAMEGGTDFISPQQVPGNSPNIPPRNLHEAA